jgi:hypothetical protein
MLGHLTVLSWFIDCGVFVDCWTDAVMKWRQTALLWNCSSVDCWIDAVMKWRQQTVLLWNCSSVDRWIESVMKWKHQTLLLWNCSSGSVVKLTLDWYWRWMSHLNYMARSDRSQTDSPNQNGESESSHPPSYWHNSGNVNCHMLSRIFCFPDLFLRQ